MMRLMVIAARTTLRTRFFGEKMQDSYLTGGLLT